MKCLNADADCKYQLKVQMLDSSEMDYEITDETRTQDLLDLVYKQLDLNENIFFGLYTPLSDGRKNWLINNRRISRQIAISSSKSTARLCFGIKFYLEDPCKLHEEASRYQFFLAVKKDILYGKLDVPFDLSAQLFAYALQSELGDYDSEMHQNNYASHYKFQANQTRKLEEKAEELHKGLIGKMPATVELSFLEEVKQLELYGTELYPLLTNKEEEEENYLALSPTGVLVLHQNSLFAHYHWTNIIGLYKKGKYFMIKVFNKDNEKTTYGFELPSKKTCKCLWRNCIEYQLFHKLIQAYFESGQSRAPSNGSQLTERFRSINLNELIVRRRKTMYNLVQSLIQHVNSLNRGSTTKERLKTDELTGINFTADEIVTYQETANYAPDAPVDVRSEKPARVEPSHEQNKNELETGASSFLPNGFYLVNQQPMTNNSVNGKLASGPLSPAMQNTLNKRKPLNAYISTPGYNVVEPSPPQPTGNMARNRKCESVFSVRSGRSRAAYSEMAYSDQRHAKHKHCSHRRAKESHRHGRRQSSCSHRHRDYHKYEEADCMSADEFEEPIKHHHRRSRARSYHTLCDENDHHKYFNEFDNETNCCARNRHHRPTHHRRKHRSCCLNELRYESDPEEEHSPVDEPDVNEETGSLCSSVHSLNKEAYCKRRHKHRKDGSKLSLKMDQPADQADVPPKPSKRSFKQPKLADKLDCEEPVDGDHQSDASDLSYCSHHSRRSRRSRGCHRSKSRCCRHSHRSRSSCGKHHHVDSDMLDYSPQHEHRGRRNASCESFSDDTDQAGELPAKLNNEKKLYRSNNQSYQSTDASLPNANQCKQQLPEMSKFAPPINKHPAQTSNQYLLPAQPFPNQQAPYEMANQIDCRALPKYNTITYRAPIDTKQIQNFLAAQNYLPNYNTITTNFIKPMHFQPPAPFYPPQQPQHQQQQQMSYQMRNGQTRNNQMNPMNSMNPVNHPNGMYFGNGLPVNSPMKAEPLTDLNKQQVYQNLQDYLKVNEMNRFESGQRPQLPPKNLTFKNAPPLPPCKPHLNTTKVSQQFKGQLEDQSVPLYAKPRKLNGMKGSEQQRANSEDGQAAEELAQSTKQAASLNSGDSANSSLQNINTLDSGISNCYSSTSTPTQDLRCSSANKTNELAKESDPKANNESSNTSDGNLDNHPNEGPKSLNKQIKPNDAANSQPVGERNPETIGQTNEQTDGSQQKPLEYYEINAEFGSTANSRAGNRLLGEYHPAIMQKLKCYEISTEL